MTRPTNATPQGRAYLAVRRSAKIAGRTTAEYFRLYVLEGFLLRLSHSEHRSRFVLKGGVLLAAYALRRPTADIDVAAPNTSNDVDAVRRYIVDIAGTVLPSALDDGLVFDLDNVTAEVIRDEDQYSGVRVGIVAHLTRARESFHVDVNVGDPIWPEPAEIALPRLIEPKPIALRGYPMEMVLAEKLVTACDKGQANTRWRDFGDVYMLTGRYRFVAAEVTAALSAVAEHRDISLRSLGKELDGYADVGQEGWTRWLARMQLTELLPGAFAHVLNAVIAFADPVLTDSISGSTGWDPARRRWNHSS